MVRRPSFAGSGLFALLLASGLGYAIYGLVTDMHASNQPPLAIGTLVLLGLALLFSPVIGFLAAGGLLLLIKRLVRRRDLYQAPQGRRPPPLWIRALLILTCTGVLFSHGGNDGQKGMGLIMLIMIGAAPTTFALNRALPDSATPGFIAVTHRAEVIFKAHSDGAPALAPDRARAVVDDALETRAVATPQVYAALSSLSADIATNVQNYGAIRHVPAEATPNVRNDMYLTAEAVRNLAKSPGAFSAHDGKTLRDYGHDLNLGTRYIPVWVKVSVAVALGLGTMVGWKRIVVTVGEKIGKDHLTCAQGASAELVAAGTIGLAEFYGLPVSTTPILSSGVAGTMAANGSGLQMTTLRNMALAWILTMPVAIALAAGLYWLLHLVF